MIQKEKVSFIIFLIDVILIIIEGKQSKGSARQRRTWWMRTGWTRPRGGGRGRGGGGRGRGGGGGGQGRGGGRSGGRGRGDRDEKQNIINNNYYYN